LPPTTSHLSYNARPDRRRSIVDVLEQIAESVAVHQAVVAHVSLQNCWTEPP